MLAEYVGLYLTTKYIDIPFAEQLPDNIVSAMMISKSADGAAKNS